MLVIVFGLYSSVLDFVPGPHVLGSADADVFCCLC